MLSSLSRLGTTTSQHGERSPFSSPFSALHSTPVAARRSSLEKRRRPAVNFNHDLSPNPTSRIDEEIEDDDDGDEDEEQVNEHDDEDSDEDGAGETSPLLPIFSAAHLGEFNQHAYHSLVNPDSSQMLFLSIISPTPYIL